MKLRNSLILVFLAIVIFQMIGEKVPYNDGAGWDGLSYREVAFNFLDQTREGGYNHYMVQRLLPFAFLNITFEFFNIPLQNDTLIKGILGLNFLVLLIGLWWYFDLVKFLGYTQQFQILGFILLFVNFPVLKVTWYEPFVTDLFAFVIGIGQLNFFIKKRKLALFILTIISGFVWPTSVIIGLIQFKNWMWGILILGVGLLVFGFYQYSTRTGKPSTELFRHIVSLCAIYLFFYGILKNINLDWKRNLAFLIHKKNWLRLGLFTITLAGFYFTIQFLSNAEPSFGLKPFLAFLIIRPIQLPFNFLVNHFLYFGMLIPLAIFYFKEVFNASSAFGLGFVMVLFVIILLGLNSESRMIINILPLLILPVLQVLKRLTLGPIVIIGLGIINLFLSKFWYTINVPGILEAFATYNTEVYMQFPAQRYFQHFGPWQNTEMFMLYGIGLVLGLSLIKFFHGSLHLNQLESTHKQI
jgi:hypothetical protein